MIKEYEDLLEKSRDRHPVIKRQLMHLAKFNNKNFDHVVKDYSLEVFKDIDCRKCANCCRTHAMQFKESDIKHISKYIGTTPNEFVEKYLRLNDDDEYIMQRLPCPFNEDDLSCNIYDTRPRACETYPDTEERTLQRHLGRLVHNTQVCPAAYLIAEKILDRYCNKDAG